MKKIFFVDVGNLPPKKADEYLRKLMEKKNGK